MCIIKLKMMHSTTNNIAHNHDPRYCFNGQLLTKHNAYFLLIEKQVSMTRKCSTQLHTTDRRGKKEIQRHTIQRTKSQATNPLFRSRMIAKLERPQSTAQQHKDPLKTPTTNGGNNIQYLNNNRTTALEQTAAEATGVGFRRGWRGASINFTGQIFALDSAIIVNTQI